MQRISDAIFHDNIQFYVFQKHFEKFPFVIDHTQSDHTLQTIVEMCCEKGQDWYENPNF